MARSSWGVLGFALRHVGAAACRVAPYVIAHGKPFCRIHGCVPRGARAATLPDASAFGVALGLSERTMPVLLRGVHTFSMSSADTSMSDSTGKTRQDHRLASCARAPCPPCLTRARAPLCRPPTLVRTGVAPSWRRIVKELLKEARVDKAVQTRVQDVLDQPVEALARADKELARADEVIAAKDKELARADKELARADKELARADARADKVIAAKDEVISRADKELVKSEEAFAMQLNVVHDDLLMMHAVYMPRSLAATLLCALAPNAESQSIGSKEIRAFVDAHIYEPGQGLGVPAGKRRFTPVAFKALSSWSHSDVQSVHKAIEGLFSEWSMPHHVIVKDARGPGSVIGARGEPYTTAEFLFFSVGIALLDELVPPGTPWPAALDNVRIITGKTALGGIEFDSRTLGRSTTTSAGVLRLRGI